MSLYFLTVALILSSGCMRQFALIFTNYDFSLLGVHMSIPSLSTKMVATNTIDNCFLMVLAYIGMMLFASVIAFTYTAFYTEEKQIQAIGQTTTAMFASVAGGQEKCVPIGVIASVVGDQQNCPSTNNCQSSVDPSSGTSFVIRK